MAAKRKSPVAKSLLLRPLGLVTALAVRFPGPVVAGAVLLAAGSLVLSAAGLGMRTNRIDLLDPESPYCKLWNEYAEQFDHKDDVVVVVEGPGPERLPAVLDAVAAEVARCDHLYQDVLVRVDLARLGPKQLYYLDLPQLERIEAALDRLGPVLAGDWSKLALRQLIARQQESGQPLPDEAELVDGLVAALRPGRAAPSLWRGLRPPQPAGQARASQYLLTRDGRFGFVLLHLVTESQRDIRRAIDRLNAMLDRLRRRFPAVHIGLTGLPVIESDEMRASRAGTLKASQLSVVGVAGLFLAGFGGWRQPLWAVLTLTFGIIWTLGYTTLTVGHLNILSMAFGVILVGLGIDFSIHYLARYQDVRPACDTTAQALRETAQHVGPGIVSGGLTSSLAFFVAGTADFPGIAELGLIVGGGILLCLIATVVVLPALVCLFDHDAAGPVARALLPIGPLLATGHKAPRATLLVTLGLTGAVVIGWGELQYDHNLLHLQPKGLESVGLERRLLAEAGQSLWYALSVADSREMVQRRKAEFLRLASVERVEEITSLLPVDAERKGPVIARIHRRLGALPARPPQFPVDAPAALRRAVDGCLEHAGRVGWSADRRRHKRRQSSTGGWQRTSKRSSRSCLPRCTGSPQSPNPRRRKWPTCRRAWCAALLVRRAAG